MYILNTLYNIAQVLIEWVIKAVSSRESLPSWLSVMLLALQLTEEWIEKHRDVAWDQERSAVPKPSHHTAHCCIGSSLIARFLTNEVSYTLPLPVQSLDSGLFACPFSSNSAPWNSSSDLLSTTLAAFSSPLPCLLSPVALSLFTTLPPSVRGHCLLFLTKPWAFFLSPAKIP